MTFTFRQSFRRLAILWGLAAGILLFLALVPMQPLSSSTYGVIHTFLEFGSIVVSVMIFSLALHAAPAREEASTSLLAYSFLGVGLLDFFHTLSIVGMPAFFTENSANKAIHFWLAARALESVAFLVAVGFRRGRRLELGNRLRFGTLITVYLIGVSWAILGFESALPRFFVPGEGLSVLKVALEYAFMIAHALTLGLILRRNAGFKILEPQEHDLAAAASLLAYSGVFFTLYVHHSDAYLLVGHAFKTVACGLIFRGVYLHSVQRPYRELALSRAALLESQTRLRTVVQEMPVLMAAIDENGVFSAWNRESERVTGYLAEEILGNPGAFELLMPDREIREKMMSELRSPKDEFRTWLWTFRAKNGEDRTIEWSSLSSTVTVPGWRSWGIGIDVTQKQELEARLRSAQKMDALGQLAGGVAHDFNNLMTILRLCCDRMAPDLELGSNARFQLEVMEKTLSRATHLTSHLLAFSRKRPLNLKVIDLNPVVEETERLLTRLIGENIGLELRLDKSLGNVRADADQLEQVLLNLAINARDAMPDGGRLSIETCNVQLSESVSHSAGNIPPGQYVCLRVSDTGKGMGPSIRTRIFEPFFTTKERGKGTGLGLAVVYGIVNQFGGSILVESEPGKGTVFTIYFPRVNEPAAERVSVRSISEKEVPRGNGETVLFAEDETEIREIVAEALRKNGYSVFAAANGQDALKLADESGATFDLLLTDVVMPVMGGRELAEKVRVTRPDLKVLYISGYIDDPSGKGSLEDSGARVLGKPFSMKELLSSVREYLDQ